MTEASYELLGLAAAQAGLEPEMISAAIADRQWNAAFRVHDWRNYISSDARTLWESLTIDARLIAFLDATKQADAEDWDSRL